MIASQAPHLLLDQVRDEDPSLHVLPVEHSAKKTAEETDIPDIDTASPGIGVQDLREQRREQERKLIDQALTAAGGNVSKAARMLNVSRQLIHYKMRKYGLVRENYRGRESNSRIGMPTS